MQKPEAAQSPFSVGDTELCCPEDERTTLVLAVAPFSRTWAPAAQLLTALPVPKSLPAGLVWGIFQL